MSCECLVAHRRRLSTSYSAPRTTWPESSARARVAPTLRSLHWLPVRQRVTYKLAVLTHKVWTTATPTYLGELVQTRAPPRVLHSSDARRSSHTHRTGPSRFFCCCFIHMEDNMLHPPADIRLCENILTFKCHLKTNLFKLT